MVVEISDKFPFGVDKVNHKEELTNIRQEAISCTFRRLQHAVRSNISIIMLLLVAVLVI